MNLPKPGQKVRFTVQVNVRPEFRRIHKRTKTYEGIFDVANLQFVYTTRWKHFRAKPKRWNLCEVMSWEEI